ncbi:hypothetical protein BDN70DRAFT_811525, partial [Pholiota conissans]
EAAHDCLAAENPAPKLHLCQPVFGKFVIVVMECAKGHPLSKFSAAALYALAKPTVFGQLEKAIDVLEKHELVHGDLRAPNIVVDSGNPQGVAMSIVNFD